MRAVRSLCGAAALVVGAATGAACSASSAAADPWRLCPQAIASQERIQGIPRHLLSAIALAESGRKHPNFDKRMPWPWTVMAEGRGRYLPTKAAAVQEVRALQARGIRNIDVGCMQVNLYYHGDAFDSIERAFDPETNVAYAGKFLSELFRDTGSWQEAAGKYHSATPEHKVPYRQRVVRYWNEQQRLELAGLTEFGSGALTSGAGTQAGTQAGDQAGGGQRIRSPAMLYAYAARRMSARAPAAAAGTSRRGAVAPVTVTPPFGPGAAAAGRRTVRPLRSPEDEQVFAARRTQYLRELRQAIAEVKRSQVVQVARDDPRGPVRAQVR